MREFKRKEIYLAVTGGASLLSVVLIAASFVCFNGEFFQSDSRIALEFGVFSDLLENRVETYLRLPPPFFMRTLIPNLFKIHADGRETLTSVAGLAPSGEDIAFGRGEASVELISIDEVEMPDFGPSPSRDNMASAVHIHEKNFPPYRRYPMMLSALVIDHWTMVKVVVWLSGLTFTGLGVGLRLLNKRTNDIEKKNAVIDLLN